MTIQSLRFCLSCLNIFRLIETNQKLRANNCSLTLGVYLKYMSTREDEGWENQSSFWPYFKAIPLKLGIFSSLSVSRTPEGKENANSVAGIFYTWTAQAILKRSRRKHKRSARGIGSIIRGNLGTMFQNRLRRITLEITPLTIINVRFYPLILTSSSLSVNTGWFLKQ